MKKIYIALGIAVGVIVLTATGYFLMAPQKPLRILWADFPPGHAFVDFVNGFTEATGIPVEVTLVSWNDFQTEAYRDVDRTYPEYDIIIGDSQWLGRNVVRGERYLELTKFVKKNDLNQIFSQPIVSAYGEYPFESGRYYAVPVIVDPMGFAYRKDWFEDEENRSAFRRRFGHELAVPETWDEVLRITEFFHRPSEGGYGISMLTSSGYDGLAMTFNNVLYPFGGDIGDRETLRAQGYINSDASVRALEFFKALYLVSAERAAGDPEFFATNVPTDNIAEGRAALALSYFSTYDPLFEAKQNFDPATIGYFAIPEGSARRFVSLGGQGASIVYRSNNQRAAKKFLRWFIEPEKLREWANVSGTAARMVVADETVAPKKYPYDEALHDSYPIMKDFWVVPEYPELLEASQRMLSEYLRDDDADAREMLNALANKWDKIFEFSPYNDLLKGGFRGTPISPAGALVTIAVILIASFAAWKTRRLFIKPNFAIYDYGDKSEEERVYYEMLSDVIGQMRWWAGDMAIQTLKDIPGLKVDENSGKVLEMSKDPVKIIATVVLLYEKLLGRRVSFKLREEELAKKHHLDSVDKSVDVVRKYFE